MKYMGGKAKISGTIVPIIQKYIDETKPWGYIEPFCGGCNIIDKVKHEHRYASDNQEYLIAFLQNLNRVTELPENVSRELYADVRTDWRKKTGKYEKWYIGAIGFLASYNGRFFDGGYGAMVKTKAGTFRNYYQEAIKNLQEQIPRLNGVKFACSDDELLNTSNAVVYCDPPYPGTKGYTSSSGFDYERFWEWVRKLSVENTVLISCKEAPSDMKCIWEKEVKRTMKSSGETVGATEKLFIAR